MPNSIRLLWALNFMYVLNLLWFWKHLSGFNAHTNDSEFTDAAIVCFSLTGLLIVRIWLWWKIEMGRSSPRKLLLVLRIFGLIALLALSAIFIMLLTA